MAAAKDESKKQLEELEQLRAETAETTRTHRTQVEEATRTRVMAEEEIRVLQRHEAETRAELKHLRALEQLRVEHREAVHREQNEVDRERRQAQEREQTLTEAFDLEKYSLQEQLEAVTAELRSCPEEFDKAEDRVGHTIPLETEPLSTPHTEGGTDPIERTGTERADRGTEGRITGLVEERLASPSESFLVATMTRLLEAHTDAIAAQTQATAAQHLPPLKAFTGEGKQVEEDGFERWIEQLEERAKVAGWSAEQKLHQIKL